MTDKATSTSTPKSSCRVRSLMRASSLDLKRGLGRGLNRLKQLWKLGESFTPEPVAYPVPAAPTPALSTTTTNICCDNPQPVCSTPGVGVGVPHQDAYAEASGSNHTSKPNSEYFDAVDPADYVLQHQLPSSAFHDWKRLGFQQSAQHQSQEPTQQPTLQELQQGFAFEDGCITPGDQLAYSLNDMMLNTPKASQNQSGFHFDINPVLADDVDTSSVHDPGASTSENLNDSILEYFSGQLDPSWNLNNDDAITSTTSVDCGYDTLSGCKTGDDFSTMMATDRFTSGDFSTMLSEDLVPGNLWTTLPGDMSTPMSPDMSMMMSPDMSMMMPPEMSMTMPPDMSMMPPDMSMMMPQDKSTSMMPPDMSMMMPQDRSTSTLMTTCDMSTLMSGDLTGDLSTMMTGETQESRDSLNDTGTSWKPQPQSNSYILPPVDEESPSWRGRGLSIFNEFARILRGEEVAARSGRKCRSVRVLARMVCFGIWLQGRVLKRRKNGVRKRIRDATHKKKEQCKKRTRTEKKYKGPTARKGKWTAEIRVSKTKNWKVWLGTYETEKKAALAYDAGLFHCTAKRDKFNFPQFVYALGESCYDDVRNGFTCGLSDNAKTIVKGFAEAHAAEFGSVRSTPPSPHWHLQEN